MLGWIGALWGLGAITLLLTSAVVRLGKIGTAAFDFPFAWFHWLILAATLVFMAYSEGYRGFQRGFSPRVAARARYLRDHPVATHVLLAPLFCMGFIHATRRRKLTALILTSAIILLIALVRLLPQPWRGIIDLGVVVGLGWGVISLLVFAARALSGAPPAADPEVPVAVTPPQHPAPPKTA
ncbi:hypothetical protein [Geoalkalibacter halelectricus]|uniref:Uncharacterized protein n=1 Tax=Geoalkalibacter halelectricus TaxID=2847045 RepID=A0ABY5ZPK5_9BACT|nr:hypothetical protein [Geoalkalibacter halelectricus]MDO3378877.1 hypothetical protein [Geoalkalibacter halelectricus]UWZ79820.1 hypothetical protein L9S41_00125 [Geoalkalibacter halelectricus]